MLRFLFQVSRTDDSLYLICLGYTILYERNLHDSPPPLYDFLARILSYIRVRFGFQKTESHWIHRAYQIQYL